MSLEQFLAQLAQKEMGGMDPLSQVPPVAPQMQPQKMQQPMQPQPQQPQLRDPMGGGSMGGPRQASPQTGKFTGLSDTLGTIGDYLLQANDMAPIYAPRKARHQQSQASEAVAAYLGNIDPALADIARNDTRTGMELFKALREDKRFDRTAGQDDRRIGIQDRQVDLGEAELGERSRSNRAGEKITSRGQDIQVQLQKMRMQDAEIDRQLRLALQSNDIAAQERLQGMKVAGQAEIARLTASLKDGGGEGTITETIEEPATKTGGFMGMGGTKTPARTVVTKRPIGSQNQGGPSQADLEYTAKKHGISVEEVKRRLGGN